MRRWRRLKESDKNASTLWKVKGLDISVGAFVYDPLTQWAKTWYIRRFGASVGNPMKQNEIENAPGQQCLGANALYYPRLKPTFNYLSDRMRLDLSSRNANSLTGLKRLKIVG